MKDFNLQKYLKKNVLLKEGIGDDMKATFASYHKGDFFNLYIANKDTQILDLRGEKVPVSSGTVILAGGGGIWKSIDGNIKTGIESLEGNPDFEVINNTTLPKVTELIGSIRNWAIQTNDLIQRDSKNARQIIADRAKVINMIRKMLK